MDKVFFSFDPLDFHGSLETDIGDAHDDPVEQGGGGTEAVDQLKSTKHIRRH